MKVSRTIKIACWIAAGSVVLPVAAFFVALRLLPTPIIVHSSWSSGGGILSSASSVSNTPQFAAPNDSNPKVLITFKRIVGAEELLRLLQPGNLSLESIYYHDVGSGSGYITFSDDAETQEAIAAAESYVRYRKLAQAFGVQEGASSVFVRGIGPMSTELPMQVIGVSGPFDWEDALRPTLEELDGIPLPECVADDRILRPIQNGGPDSALVEAACGFRPFAISVQGDRTEIEAFAAEHAVVDQISFNPSLD